MTGFTGAYPIARRAGEIERLAVQAAAFAPAARALFAAAGVAPGWRCVDLGCGPGGVTPLLAEAVGATGAVTGVDRDDVFLEHARANAAPQTRFVHADAYATGLPGATFDLAHARFVAGTAGRPEALLAEASRLVRPGGAVALQEPDMSTLRAFPSHPAFDRLKSALIAAFARADADITAAHGLYALARRAGLVEVGYRTVLLGVRATDPMVDYLPATVVSLTAAILAAGAYDAATLDADLAACRAHVGDPDTVFTMFTVVQVWGRRAA